MRMNDLRQIPSVDSLLQQDDVKVLRQEYGDLLVVETLRKILTDFRKALQSTASSFSIPEFVKQVTAELQEKTQTTLQPVINATGVILHTNLGRAVLAESALKSLEQISRGYSTLEFNLESGSRGSRSVHAHDLLTRLTGAEDALVVNNNAAAVLLVLTVLAKRKKVVISRGQLVEIGGGFRVPEVMKVSDARLLEVGTTNRVRLEDYEEALTNGAGLVMRAHASNFKIIGFTEEPELPDLVSLTHMHGALFIDDIGSGALIDTTRFGLRKEPLVLDSVTAGADIVCFSGDKLLGGPQAGIIIGKKGLIARIKKHPLARAVRADKLCLAALEATLLHYLKGNVLDEIPVWKMISRHPADLQTQAIGWQKALETGEVIPEFSTIGGGSLPGEMLPTFVLAIQVKQVDKALAQLRKNTPPIIGRIKDDRILFDPRTVLNSEEKILLDGIKTILLKEPA
jgi:L-seryl-tRNA(Ser) seleniumtransferase